MYTTIKGNTVPLTPKVWRGIKRLAQRRFDGSQDLFDACWREYRRLLSGTDDPSELNDVLSWLDTIATGKVNNPRSRFFIYG